MSTPTLSTGKTIRECRGCLHSDRWSDCNVMLSPARAWASETGCLAYRDTLEAIEQAEAERLEYLGPREITGNLRKPVIVPARHL